MEHTARQSGPQAGRWAAPAAAGPVRARLAIPGSKSMTNRALVLAALADGPGTIASPLQARDTLLMRAALTALGATIDGNGHYDPGAAGPAPSWQVSPGGRSRRQRGCRQRRHGTALRATRRRPHRRRCGLPR